MNKILLVSDLTLDIIQKKLTKILDSQYYSIENMFGDINISLASINPNDYNYIVIIFDPYFAKYSSSEYDLISDSIARFINNTTSSNVIVNNFLNANVSSQLYFTKRGNNFNDLLAKVHDDKNLIILDYLSYINTLSIDGFYNFNLGHLFQMPFSKPALESIATGIANSVISFTHPEKKVIVLDCDNTLWGGVVGEDGIDGIKCSKNADGIIYFHFQKFLKALQENGFLLCLCSKNNFVDVEEAFNKKNMPLKFEDFIVKKINWQNKITNIQEIANELNLGLNSFVFIDDSDFEVGTVSSSLKDVTVIQFTPDYKDFIKISQLNCLKKRRILIEDKRKMQQYLDNHERKRLQDNITSIDDYIAKLDIKCEYRVNDMENIARLAQLTEKTNQFNFNKVPFSSSELVNYIEAGNLVISLAVSDKFGDYGIVGVALINITNQSSILENIIISCRALGRKIEYQFWEYLKQQINQREYKLSKIIFIKTSKNQPAEDFYNQIKGEL